MGEDCSQQEEHIGNDYVADPLLDARHRSKPDKVIVLQDFTLLWINEQNNEVSGVKSSMMKREKYKEIENDRRKYYYFYLTDENTEKLKKQVNYRVAHSFNYYAILFALPLLTHIIWVL